MAKLTILSPFDQIAQPLEDARTQIVIEVFDMGFWGHLSRPLFLVKLCILVKKYKVLSLKKVFVNKEKSEKNSLKHLFISSRSSQFFY